MKKDRRKNIKKIIFTNSLLASLIILTIITAISSNKNIKEKEVSAMTVTDNNLDKDAIIPGKPAREIDSKTTDWNLILVNQDNEIPEDYNVELKDIGNGNKVDIRIEDVAKEMIKAVIKIGLKPYICSSYRTSDTQITLFNNKVNQYQKAGYTKEEAENKASGWVAKPRTSEHEIGLALDIVSSDYQVLDEEQEKTRVQKWLIENCVNYGFVLRYPTNKKEITKINYEPWHYRYVGVENAKFMKEKDFCLEEYIEYLKN